MINLHSNHFLKFPPKIIRNRDSNIKINSISNRWIIYKMIQIILKIMFINEAMITYNKYNSRKTNTTKRAFPPQQIEI